MVGSLAVKSVPRPSAGVVQEAMNLLSVLGGNKSANELLKKMLEVQTHNEELIVQAKEIIAEADRRDKEVTDREVDLKHRVESVEKDIELQLRDIAERKTNADLQISRERNELKEYEGRLAAERESIDRMIREHDSKVISDTEQLKVSEQNLVVREEELEKGKQQLVSDQNDLAREVEKLNKREIGLNNREDTLNLRDERLRAAMDL